MTVTATARPSPVKETPRVSRESLLNAITSLIGDPKTEERQLRRAIFALAGGYDAALPSMTPRKRVRLCAALRTALRAQKQTTTR